MDPMRIGELIRQRRKALHLTQAALAACIHVSDKAVSKWERGNGCPDVSLMAALAEVLGADLHALLTGDTHPNESGNGDMKKLKFYVCGTCGNVVTAASEAGVTCCGTKLSPLTPRRAEPHEMLHVEVLDGEWYITSAHPMTKSHSIAFAAYVNDSSVMLFRQYPEWNMQVTLPVMRAGKLLWYCSTCGLLYQELRP